VLDAMPVGDATAPLLERVVAASELVDETLARVRVIATELRPGSLDALGLGPALEQEARAFRDRSGIPCEVRIEPAAADQRGEVATALFRIAQESLTNVLRHAQAKRVSLSLTLEGEELALRVADDGVGLDPARVSGGLGLVGMRERAGALGGAVKLEHGAGGGTTVTVHIPFAP
jgi:signal transduction histidine kinase